MQRTIFFCLTALCVAACEGPQQRTLCRQVKTGHFLFRRHQPDFHYEAFIDRTDSIQTETDQITGDVSTLAVRWVDDCEYELRLISSTKPFSDSIQHIRKTVPLHTKIVGGTDRYYLFKSYRDNSSIVLSDTMWLRQ